MDSKGYEVTNSLFSFDPVELDRMGVKKVPLYYLSKALEVMSKCDAVYYCEGWENARGCQIEYAAATAYGLVTICWPEFLRRNSHDGTLYLDNKHDPSGVFCSVSHSL